MTPAEIREEIRDILENIAPDEDLSDLKDDVDPDAVVPPFDILNPVPVQPSGPLTNAYPGVTISTAATAHWSTAPMSASSSATTKRSTSISTARTRFAPRSIPCRKCRSTRRKERSCRYPRWPSGCLAWLSFGLFCPDRHRCNRCTCIPITG